MDMILMWKAGREAVNRICAENVYTRFRVQDGRLFVNAPGGLSDIQTQYILACKDAIVHYLTTRPEDGECRRGHTINWVCSEHGDWVCQCYFSPTASQAQGDTTDPAAANTKSPSSVINYWLRKAN